MTRHSDRVVVIGAGIGGLTCAIALAVRGYETMIVERRSRPGGKMERVRVGDAEVDTGPTVFTMRWVFDRLLAQAGTSLDAVAAVSRLPMLARHRWLDGSALDLFADIDESADAIAAFSNARNAWGYRRFCRDTARIFEALNATFMEAQRPGPIELMRRIGPAHIGDMLALRPFTTMWKALGGYFPDPRLRQLFGRYATYCGASPFLAPATLMLVAHVEQRGVWAIEGGMAALADGLAQVARRLGVTIRYERDVAAIEADDRIRGVRFADGEMLPARAVVFNGDVAALAAGDLGNKAAIGRRTAPDARSLSAMTWAMDARTDGADLAAHTVLFSGDYASEFEALFRQRRLPDGPTVYLFAPDRCQAGAAAEHGKERLFCLINAPADGDTARYDESETDRCLEKLLAHLRRYGVTVQPLNAAVRTPADYADLFPATGGALYGRAPHGWTASFRRPGARTRIPGLYLAGGSAHPGPGVPMAALSGQLAAECLASDRASTPRFRPAGISGGTSMR